MPRFRDKISGEVEDAIQVSIVRTRENRMCPIIENNVIEFLCGSNFSIKYDRDENIQIEITDGLGGKKYIARDTDYIIRTKILNYTRYLVMTADNFKHAYEKVV